MVLEVSYYVFYRTDNLEGLQVTRVDDAASRIPQRLPLEGVQYPVVGVLMAQVSPSAWKDDPAGWLEGPALQAGLDFKIITQQGNSLTTRQLEIVVEKWTKGTRFP